MTSATGGVRAWGPGTGAVGLATNKGVALL